MLIHGWGLSVYTCSYMVMQERACAQWCWGSVRGRFQARVAQRANQAIMFIVVSDGWMGTGGLTGLNLFVQLSL